MTFTAGQKVTAAQLNALETKYGLVTKSTNQTLTTTITDLAGCSLTITTFVANVVVKITADLDLEASGSGDIGIVSAQVNSNPLLAGDLNFQRAGRDPGLRSWLDTLATPGSYTIKLRGYKIGAANMLTVYATHSRMIVEGAGFTI
jgi:hypothetical protein